MLDFPRAFTYAPIPTILGFGGLMARADGDRIPSSEGMERFAFPFSEISRILVFLAGVDPVPSGRKILFSPLPLGGRDQSIVAGKGDR